MYTLSSLIFLNNLSKTRIILYFSLIIFSGLVFRYIFFPFDIPIVLDGLGYFWYAMDLNVTKAFPTNHDLPNNFWPTLLSTFFSVSNSENFLDYMSIQRNISIIFSVFTSIPAYYLAKKFLKKEYALMVPLIFIFEPRIIENSLFGITESIFIFFVTSSLALFFHEGKKSILLSFILAGIFCLIRYEGLMMISAMFGILFYRFRNKKKNIVFGVLMILVFILVLAPMSSIRNDTMGYDGIFSHVGTGMIHVGQEGILGKLQENNVKKFFPDVGILNFIKLFGWILIPTFTIFLPIGIFYFLKTKKRENFELIIISAFALIPALYAFSRDISDVRYFFVVFPVIAILVIYAIDVISKKTNRRDLISLLFLILILIGSFAFFIVNSIDYEYERESFLISNEIYHLVEGVNASYYPEGAYLRVAQLTDSSFPITSTEGKSKINFISSVDEGNLEDYIINGKDKGLTHLIIDHKFIEDEDRRDQFLGDVFMNEENYSYLIKEFDSAQEGFSVHVKIFRIDFEKFEFREKLD